MEENLFEFFFDENLMAGVYGASLVKSPAIEVEMIKFSKENEIRFANEEKKILVSPLLIPNQRVWRNNLQGYVFASEETIEKLQQNFAKNNYNHNSTIEHDGELIEDVFFFESWIIEDPENDKSNALGFKNLPKGTWMVSMKINNQEIWDNYIKTGEVLGLSIDAMLASRKVETKKIKQEMKKETMEEIIRLSIQKVALAFELNEYILEDGSSVFASSLEVGSIVTDKDGNALVDYEFTYEGKSYSTDEMGAIKELEVKEEEAPVEEPVVMAEGDVTVDTQVEAPMVDDKAVIVELEAKIKELEDKLAQVEIEKANLESKIVSNENDIVSFKNETASNKGIIDRPTIVETKPKSAIEAIRAALK